MECVQPVASQWGSDPLYMVVPWVQAVRLPSPRLTVGALRSVGPIVGFPLGPEHNLERGPFRSYLLHLEINSCVLLLNCPGSVYSICHKPKEVTPVLPVE